MVIKRVSQTLFSRYIPAGLFLIALLYLTVFVNFTTDRSDGIFHFLFAKSAPVHPELYLDLWAKPLFTLVASPFAQFGFQGMHFMNVLCAVATALVCVNIARHLNLKYGWMIFFLLIPMPVYFNQLCAAMTEPFFALLLSFIVLLFVQKKFNASAILASLLPFARQEGYLLIPLMVLIFLLLKKWKAIPFLFSGIFLFSLVTLFATGDFFWFISEHPYTGAEDIYGRGSLFHFLKNSEAMFGFFIQLFSAAGFVIICYLFFRNSKAGVAGWQTNIPLITEFFLIAGFAAVFFLAHSVMWWKGLFGSYGLERVMACIAPLIALISLRAVNTLLSYAENKKVQSYFKTFFLLAISLLPLIILATRSNFPPKENLSDGEKTVAKAAEWIKTEKPFYSKIYFSHPYFILQLGLDPKGEKNSEELMYTDQGKKIPEDALVLWDSEYSAGQHHFPLQLLQNSSYQLLKTVVGANETVVHIYRKI